MVITKQWRPFTHANKKECVVPFLPNRLGWWLVLKKEKEKTFFVSPKTQRGGGEGKRGCKEGELQKQNGAARSRMGWLEAEWDG